MAQVKFNIPVEVEGIIKKHKEIQWDSIVSNLLWQYAKKIELVERMISKSRLTERDAEQIGGLVKIALLKKYMGK